MLLELLQGGLPGGGIQMQGRALEAAHHREAGAVEVALGGLGIDPGEAGEAAGEGRVGLDARGGGLQADIRVAGAPQPHAVDHALAGGFAGGVDRVVVEPHLQLVRQARPAGDVLAFGHEQLHRPAIDVGQRVEERARLVGEGDVPAIRRGGLEAADVGEGVVEAGDERGGFVGGDAEAGGVGQKQLVAGKVQVHRIAAQPVGVGRGWGFAGAAQGCVGQAGIGRAEAGGEPGFGRDGGLPAGLGVAQQRGQRRQRQVSGGVTGTAAGPGEAGHDKVKLHGCDGVAAGLASPAGECKFGCRV